MKYHCVKYYYIKYHCAKYHQATYRCMKYCSMKYQCAKYHRQSNSDKILMPYSKIYDLSLPNMYSYENRWYFACRYFLWWYFAQWYFKRLFQLPTVFLWKCSRKKQCQYFPLTPWVMRHRWRQFFWVHIDCIWYLLNLI